MEKILNFRWQILVFLLSFLAVFLFVFGPGVRTTETVSIFLFSQEGKEGVVNFCVDNQPQYQAPLDGPTQKTEIVLPEKLLDEADFKQSLKSIFNQSQVPIYELHLNSDKAVAFSKKWGTTNLAAGTYILIHKDSSLLLSGRSYVLEKSLYYLSKIKMLGFQGARFAVAVNADETEGIFQEINKDGVYDFELSQFAKFSYRKLSFLIELAFWIALLITCFSLPQVRGQIVRVFKSNLIIFIPTLCVVLGVYAVIWPGYYGLEMLEPWSYMEVWTHWFSDAYMVMTDLFSTVDHSLFGTLNVLMFLFTLFQVVKLASDNFGREWNYSRKLAVLLVLFVFFLFKGTLLTFFGAQRFHTSPWFFISAWICLYRSRQATQDPHNYLLSLAGALYALAYALRPEYLLFAPLFFWEFFRRLNFKSVRSSRAQWILIFGALFSIYTYNQLKTEISRDYRMASLQIMGAPYAELEKDDAEAKIFFKRFDTVTEEEYKKALPWFIKHVIHHPTPYLTHQFTMLFDSVFEQSPWGCQPNKFSQIQDRMSSKGCGFGMCCAEAQVVNFFVNSYQYVPISENVYSGIISYMHTSDPWFKNGLLFSMLFILFLFPILFSGNRYLLVANVIYILRFLASVLLAPAAAPGYYYDGLLWVMFNLIILIGERRQLFKTH